MANSTGNLLKLPVDCLRPGLYVDALDRPWTDTPFVFQGFAIEHEGEIRALGHYCQHVFVDVERSQGGELAEARQSAALRSATSETGPAPAARPTRPDSNSPTKATSARSPSGRRFRQMVAAAKTGRDHCRRAVDRIMTDLRFGYRVDTRVAREAVEDLVRRVSGDASAALWLTNLKNRDEYTSIHCVNVCVLALALGLHLDLEREELIRLGTGALLHDVGKTRTPNHILNKAGPLTDAEYEIIKRHAEDGYQLLREAGGTSAEVLEIVRLHHERMSGAGYPFGLSGEQIPLRVRITGLVDTYDAMTSDRAYRGAISADDALKALYERAADEFGADLVEAFIHCLGIFPIGSVVELDTGAIGVVVETHPEARLHPTLLMVRTADGLPYSERLLLDLAVAPQSENDPQPHARRITRTLAPAQAGVDVASLIRAEINGHTGQAALG